MIKMFTVAAIALGLAGALAGPAHSEASPPAVAKALLTNGQKRAAKQHKRVLVMFHSTW